MKLALKIIIILVVLVGGFLYWIQSTKNVPTLTIEEDDSPTERVEKADAWIQQIHEKNKFNGGVLLIQNDRIILKKTYGFTDHTQSKELNANSAFRLASVSKQFTATGIMLLKEQGKLNFDDAITLYLPELSYENVSIRNLLNHTSGIPDAYMDFPKTYGEQIGSELSIAEVVKFLGKANLPLQEEPNSQFRYNNTGYVLLAAIIERISNMSFEEFLQKELFDPLEMKDSRVWNLVTTNPNFENKTGSFDNFMGTITELKPGVLDGLSGDGGVFLSLDDFVIWNQFWNENSLLSKETMQEAFVKPTLSNEEQMNYGFGWIVTDNGAIWHNGSWLGARTFIAINTKSKNCLVILDNSSSESIDLMGRQLGKVFE